VSMSVPFPIMTPSTDEDEDSGRLQRLHGLERGNAGPVGRHSVAARGSRKCGTWRHFRGSKGAASGLEPDAARERVGYDLRGAPVVKDAWRILVRGSRPVSVVVGDLFAHARAEGALFVEIRTRPVVGGDSDVFGVHP